VRGLPEKFFPRNFSPKIAAALKGKVEKSPPLMMISQEAYLYSKSGTRIPVRFSPKILMREQQPEGAVGFFQDLRPLKILPREKLRAERLAVVGQTVAGLAHGVKNMITAMGSGLFSLHFISLVHDSEKTKPHLSLRNGVPSLHSM
jgi:hypothetical protein